MVVTARRMTADEFLALPPEPNTQLIDGNVVVSDPALRHQRIVAYLYGSFFVWAQASPGKGEPGLGFNYQIDDHNVFIPDVWFFSEARRPVGNIPFLDGVPDLVVEVRSPSTWRYDIGVKKDGYRRRGVAELWLVDTKADRVLVFRGDEELALSGGDQLTTPLMPGLAINLTDLFDR
ncbi:MAG: Uma2 family endonuclease [Acidimicrobiales bacterium]